MKCTLALPLLVALAAPAAASTIHSFDIRVTPRYLEAFSNWEGQGVYKSGDPVPPGISCRDSGAGDGSSVCSFVGRPSHDLVQLKEQYGPAFSTNVRMTPLEGRISFDGTGKVACGGELARVIWSCGETGGTGSEPDWTVPGNWVMHSNATSSSFDLFGMERTGGLIESFGMYGGFTEEDASATLSLGGMYFQTHYPGFRLSYDIELLLDVAQPGNLPSPVPLPASLPLLAGALAVAGGFGRRRRVSRR